MRLATAKYSDGEAQTSSKNMHCKASSHTHQMTAHRAHTAQLTQGMFTAPEQIITREISVPIERCAVRAEHQIKFQ